MLTIVSRVDDDNDDITADEVSHEMQRQILDARAIGVTVLSSVMSAFFTLVGLIGVVVGLVVAFDGDDVGDRKLGEGTVIIVASLVQAGIMLILTRTAGLIARYIRLRSGTPSL